MNERNREITVGDRKGVCLQAKEKGDLWVFVYDEGYIID